MSTGEFAENQEGVPLTRNERKFRTEAEEETPEIKERGMKLPASEVKKQQTKRTREKEKKKIKAEEEETERSEKKRKEDQKRRRRKEEKRRKKRRKKGPQAVAVPLRHVRVFLRSPSTHPEEEWVGHLQMMKRTEVC